MKFVEMDRNELSFATLRFAVGGVFLWFGLDKFFHPDAWLGWVPGWMLTVIPLEDTLFMTLQGAVEFCIGIAFVSKRFVRPAAILTVVMMTVVSLSIGANEVAVRDMGILGASLALLIIADGSAKRPIGRRRLSVVVSLYVLLVFVTGVMFFGS